MSFNPMVRSTSSRDFILFDGTSVRERNVMVTSSYDGLPGGLLQGTTTGTFEKGYKCHAALSLVHRGDSSCTADDSLLVHHPCRWFLAEEGFCQVSRLAKQQGSKDQEQEFTGFCEHHHRETKMVECEGMTVWTVRGVRVVG